MRVGITGSSGLIGTALRARLGERGYVVVPIVQRLPDAGEIGWNPTEGRLDPQDLVGLDAIVNLAGASISDRRWTGKHRRVLIESRTVGTRLIAEAMATRRQRGDEPTTLVSASATGYYGDRDHEIVDESSSPGTNLLSEICAASEAATAPAAAAGVNVAAIRTGNVLSGHGGGLPKLLTLFKSGLGGPFGNSQQWMSWISLHDEVAAIECVLDDPVSGAVNLVTPNPVVNREFASTLGSVLRRPSALPLPRFAPRLLLGRERADALLFDGHRVVPQNLLARGFDFDTQRSKRRCLLSSTDDERAAENHIRDGHQRAAG